MKLLGLLLTLLVVSLSANVMLWRAAYDFYVRLNALRLDPFETEQYARSPHHTDDGRPLVVFFGDSRAYQWTCPPMPQYAYLNRGIGGQSSAQVLGRFDAEIGGWRPAVIVVQAGVNDLKMIPLRPAQKTQLLANCQRNLRELVARAEATGARVIVTTIFPVGDLPVTRKPFGRLFRSDEVAAAIADVNQALLTCASDRVRILDAHAILADTRGKVQPRYQIDWLHINQAGYAALNQALQAMLYDFES